MSPPTACSSLPTSSASATTTRGSSTSTAPPKPGTDVRELLGLDDVIFDLSITPNRPDAMCIVGVAREVAAHFGLPLHVPDAHASTDPKVGSDITVRVDAPDRCPRYLGRVARVAMGPSPSWMAQRLVKAGMRPISNVVDVTNYVLLERNQPLHAFDLGRLAGRGILVRLAERGEHITTLDGVDRALSEEDLLICDAAGAPQAIAGVMGGGTSEVSDTTSEILLESAYFERMGIARTSKRLKLRSESSARFERGIDPNGVAEHSERAMELFADVAEAKVAGEAVDEYPQPVERVRIHVRTSKVNGVLGTDLRDTEILDSLRPLGIEVEGSGDDITAVAPTFRPDLEREIDIVEEVARRVGFASIGRTVARPREQVGSLTKRQRERRVAADALVGAGLSEAVTIPLVAPADLERAGAPLERLVEAANPLRAEESVLRTRILPGLLRAVAHNHAHGLTDVGLFEVGRVFLAPAGRERCCPRNRLISRLRWRARSAGGRSRPIARSTRSTCSTCCTRSSTRSRSPPVGPRPQPGPASILLAPPRSSSTARRSASWGSWTRAYSSRWSSRRRSSGSNWISIDCSTAVAGIARSGRLPRTRRRRSISRSSWTRMSRPETWPRRFAAPPASALEEVRLFDVFRSDALGAGRKSLAFALEVPGAGPDAHRRRGGGDPPAVRRGRRPRAPRRAAGLTSWPSCTASDPDTPKSTPRAWCSTRTGSPTSTKPARDGSRSWGSTPRRRSSGTST